MKLISVKSAAGLSGHQLATNEDFSIRHNGRNSGMVALHRSLKGPQDIELEIIIKWFKGGVEENFSKAMLMLYISEHEF